MSLFGESIDVVVKELEKFDKMRERAIHITRKLNRNSGRAIALIVKNEDPNQYLEDARKLMKELSGLMGELAPVTSWSLTSSGTEEFAELELLLAITSGKTIPEPKDLSVPSWIWIAAVGDCIGELRRMMLASLIDENLDKARLYLGYVQELYDSIIGLEFSKSLVPNLRRKIDIARTLIDKCESDFANAVINKKTKSS